MSGCSIERGYDMCESTAYIVRADTQEKIMETVAQVKPLGEGKYLLRGILGESVEVEGTIEEIDLMGHRILFTPKG